MRLINADLLKENCKCTGGFDDNFLCVDLIELAKVIDAQPTVYDKDKVVKQLEDLRKECEDPLQDYCPDCFIDRAIDIVKGGGVND